MDLALYIAALVLLAALGWHLVGLRMADTTPPPYDPHPHAHGTRDSL